MLMKESSASKDLTGKSGLASECRMTPWRLARFVPCKSQSWTKLGFEIIFCQSHFYPLAVATGMSNQPE
jgi:hypothetical protein